MIKLTHSGTYKDGGSKRFVGKDGQQYWQCFSIGDEKNKGKLFIGNINDKPWKLAVGEFALMEVETRKYKKGVVITQK